MNRCMVDRATRPAARDCPCMKEDQIREILVKNHMMLCRRERRKGEHGASLLLYEAWCDGAMAVGLLCPVCCFGGLSLVS